MAYNSAYTGSQVDAAVGAVRQKETIWDGKQDELTGTEDQLVGFNSAGEAVAVAKPDPLPAGGETGQVLTKTAEGTAWDDIPSDLPAGGTDGQILTKTEDGVAWENSAASTTVTLTTSGWAGDVAPYSQQVACSIVKSDSAVVSVDAQTSGDPDANAEILNAWALVSQKDPMQMNGRLRFYATEKPTVNIPVKVGVS